MIVGASVTDDLTSEQLAVTEAPPTARTLVTAPPGAGKTHLLIARLAKLVEKGLPPGRGVLVVSFSRAAVGEIRRRTATAGGDLRYVRAQTFDSFATALLFRLQPGGQWEQDSYDQRIRRATDLIAGGEDGRQLWADTPRPRPAARAGSAGR